MMAQAIVEGSKGVGLTAPNPSVGAVVVREGKIVARGFHRGVGQPHAEIEAIADADRKGVNLKECEIFITLEPCSSYGRTPPCTAALIANGFRRVVWAADDPNPNHSGRAWEILRDAGIEVDRGLLAEEAAYLHRAFFKVQRKGLPWLIVKTAMSLDGRLTRPPGEGQWLTSPSAREDVQKLRGEADAILTSGETARSDNPRLNYRGPRAEKKQLKRVVLTRIPEAGLSAGAHLLNPTESGPTRFEGGDIEQILRNLAQEGIQTILVEAGGRLVGDLLKLGLVDEWVAYYAPLVSGGPVPSVGGGQESHLPRPLSLKNLVYEQVGPDLKVRGLIGPQLLKKSESLRRKGETE
ncbi:bifunctional diaminohydroxyphosphoribosylaminopyrimidine deaminase/5-amino-6-(5-phosphoribosylamino)uracil reductase RibD [Roseibacillus ishigakijimensis]|uniref:bifunctional diaminohydroxyphosphoribosylaminopyrimidine deaminase/5-amino-6-(5-phosphoribosylamino)uracil reductase RibD n=1 Tax=Roseibacillus ishigakijimensis TaxID=454146 RepID=UPI0022792039|nr:bifunctional diaminohydroxyphosphoribosylaminopyrimidine deaminase/5-amino-6-(5-phosphoribosylamino)uracil reductase RibD [Roseibacillus ishigakijimensis]